MEQIQSQIEAQEKINKIVKQRQEQISELKLYFDLTITNYTKISPDWVQIYKNLKIYSQNSNID